MAQRSQRRGVVEEQPVSSAATPENERSNFPRNVSTRASGQRSVEIAISDTGAGIPQDMLDHVFEPFYTTKTGGLGLGLSIARSIADAHGVRLWACSKEGTGATFLLRLTGPGSREGGNA